MAIFSRVTFLAVFQIDRSKEQHLAFRIFLLEFSRYTVPVIATKTIFSFWFILRQRWVLSFFIATKTRALATSLCLGVEILGKWLQLTHLKAQGVFRQDGSEEVVVCSTSNLFQVLKCFTRQWSV